MRRFFDKLKQSAGKGCVTLPAVCLQFPPGSATPPAFALRFPPPEYRGREYGPRRYAATGGHDRAGARAPKASLFVLVASYVAAGVLGASTARAKAEFTVTARPPATAPAAAPATAPAEAAAAGPVWLTNLDQGYKDAAKRGRPMLVIYGAAWCGPCRALEKEMDAPSVQSKLANWTLVHLDVDKPEPGAPAYAGPIPALRVLTAGGKPVASRDGYLSGEDLLRWLRESVPGSEPVDPDLVGAEAPDAEAVGRLVAKLAGADAAAREAAVHRLTPFPQAAAGAVAAVFEKGNLKTRLSALDLLTEWGAPTKGIDPWEPRTIDAARLEAIRKWATSVKPPATQPSGPPALLDSSRLDGARHDLAALLRASDPPEVRVLLDRLARVGPALLPEVLDRIKRATSDHDRERLTAVRYRLVATDSLALGWPGGLERLASADTQTRHDAADQLVKRATADDLPLLLQLFSDPDPLVREISLRGLEALGGPSATAALVNLLHDPVLNVRAAVLKQLAEEPSAEMADAVIGYIAQEKDADLLVHAVRVLRAARGAKAVTCLVGMTTHESWRVRAEAVDALAEIQQKDRVSSGAAQEQAAAAVTKLVEDPDGFVAGRALAAMKVFVSGSALKTMIETAKRRPELALEVVKMLASESGNDVSVSAALRGFCSHEKPAVRAAAVVALAFNSPRNCEKEIQAALRDTVTDVRVAGGNAAFSIFEISQPQNGYIEKPSFFGIGGGRVKVDSAEWLENFRTGKGRPEWTGGVIPDLQKMLKSADKSERLAAAQPLVAMGHEDEALPVVLAEANADAGVRVSATRLLPWLPWEKRLSWFNTLAAMPAVEGLVRNLAEHMAVMSDARAAEVLWGLLARKDAEAAQAVFSALQQSYTGQRYINSGDGQDALLKPMADAARAKVEGGSDEQRVVALALLLTAAPEEAAVQAKKICEDAKASAPLRLDGLHVLLLAQPAEEAERTATAAMAGDSPAARKMALSFLAMGGDALGQLHGSIYISYSIRRTVSYNGKPAVLKAPEGLTAEKLTPFLQGADHQDAAYAGYLLCLMGNRDGLPPLLQQWREQQKQRSNQWDRLAYRAIAALDDDAQTPVLEQIYKGYNQQSYYVREFYWTIRGMHGPAVLKLRKTIRDEVGMQQLQ
ncbi:MAG: trxA 4 [Phycisphaerales bacterium]|nr:trxA 4 [Phycisphaerales bacterium]